MAEMMRLTTRIGIDANAWLDGESERTGVPKSTLVHLAIEHYIQQKQVIASMSEMGAVNELVNRIEQLEQLVHQSVTKSVEKG